MPHHTQIHHCMIYHSQHRVGKKVLMKNCVRGKQSIRNPFLTYFVSMVIYIQRVSVSSHYYQLDLSNLLHQRHIRHPHQVAMVVIWHQQHARYIETQSLYIVTICTDNLTLNEKTSGGYGDYHSSEQQQVAGYSLIRECSVHWPVWF